MYIVIIIYYNSEYKLIFLVTRILKNNLLLYLTSPAEWWRGGCEGGPHT
jgi:hypothetical protein